MIPLKDDNPTQNKSIVRLVILLVCLIVFLLQISSANKNELLFYYGFKPASILNSDFANYTFSPTLTIFTSMFMHGGWLHFLSNMLYLWIFADNVEDVLGKKKFIFFYIMSGISAAIFQMLADINSQIPMVGASGAIAGVLGAYMYLFPKAKILVLVPLLIFFFTTRLPAVLVIGMWIIIQFINISFVDQSTSNVAWFAHIGGFIFGLFYCILFVRKKTIRKANSILPKKKKNPWGN